jgi:hypothetical protein
VRKKEKKVKHEEEEEEEEECPFWTLFKRKEKKIQHIHFLVHGHSACFTSVYTQ